MKAISKKNLKYVTQHFAFLICAPRTFVKMYPAPVVLTMKYFFILPILLLSDFNADHTRYERSFLVWSVFGFARSRACPSSNGQTCSDMPPYSFSQRSLHCFFFCLPMTCSHRFKKIIFKTFFLPLSLL